MKKQFIVALAIMVATFSFAQKKELKEAEKAIKDNNFAEAKTLLSQVEPMLSSMDDKYKAQYYYLNAEALYANGSANNDDVAKALKSLGLVQGEYAEESKVLKNSMIQSFVKKGNEAYESKDYSVSSKNFENAYRVSPQDTLYLYYAAVTATGVQEFDRALVLYEELEELNYTGIETEYLAIDKETGEIEVFQSKNIRDISVKGGTHLKPTQRQTESKQGEIVKNMALIYTNQGDNEKALAALSRARNLKIYYKKLQKEILKTQNYNLI